MSEVPENQVREHFMAVSAELRNRRRFLDLHNLADHYKWLRLEHPVEISNVKRNLQNELLTHD